MSNLSRMIVAALIGMGSASSLLVPRLPHGTLAAPRRLSNITGTANRYVFSAETYLKKNGHSVAQGKRMAAKKRNQARHKRATKGK